MSRAPAKAVPMACLTIGFQTFLLPADKAMKVAELMQHACDCKSEYEDRGYVYYPTEQPRVEFALVRASEIRMPHGQPMPMPATRQRLPK